MKPKLDKRFQADIDAIVLSHGHHHAASILCAMQIEFEDAYKLIFHRAPRDLAADQLDFTLPDERPSTMKIGNQTAVLLANLAGH